MCFATVGPDEVVRGTIILTVINIVSDFLVLSFPIAILWRVRIDVRQKIGLGFSLCLSIVMIIATIIRIAGMTVNGKLVDIVWLFFWWQQEASIAVIMVSVTAFRFFFVANALSHEPQRPKLSSFWRKRLEKKRASHGQNSDELPQIPHATLTGMRTMIHKTQEPGTTQARSSLEKTGFEPPATRSIVPDSSDAVWV